MESSVVKDVKAAENVEGTAINDSSMNQKQESDNNNKDEVENLGLP